MNNTGVEVKAPTGEATGEFAWSERMSCLNFQIKCAADGDDGLYESMMLKTKLAQRHNIITIEYIIIWCVDITLQLIVL